MSISSQQIDPLQTANVEQLLGSARDGKSEPLGQLLKMYQNYLTILATTQLDRRLRNRLSPSDLVQETLLAAHRDFQKFRGHSEREFLGWLRQVFINCLHHLVEVHIRAKKRDVRCEVSIENVNSALDKSAENLGHILADPGPSPSNIAGKRERAVALADQLAQLKPDYRDVIVLRNLQGLSFEEIAERMDKKAGSVRMMWLRAIEKLKQLYDSAD